MSTTSKQDRQGSRTPADLERKYDLGSMGDRFAEVMGIALDAQTHSEAAMDAVEQTNGVVADISKKVDEISITVKDFDSGMVTQLSTKVDAFSVYVSQLGTQVNSAEFVIGVINGQSTAKISADKLDIIGKKLNIKVDATNIEGKVTAKQIDVLDLSAFGATIGGWNINESSILKVRETTLDNTDVRLRAVSISSPSKDTDKVFFIDDITVDEIGGLVTESHPFYVRADGYLHSEYGDIGGWSISASGLSRSHTYNSRKHDLQLTSFGIQSTLTYLANGSYSRASLYDGKLNITESTPGFPYGYVIAYYSNDELGDAGYIVYIDRNDLTVKAEMRYG